MLSGGLRHCGALLHTLTHAHARSWNMPASPQDTELLRGLNYRHFISGRKGGGAGEGAVNSAPQACPSKAWTKCHSVSVPICLWVGGWKYRQGRVPQIQNAKEKAPKETHRLTRILLPHRHSHVHTDAHAHLNTHACVLHTHLYTYVILSLTQSTNTLGASELHRPLPPPSVFREHSLTPGPILTHTPQLPTQTHTSQGLSCRLLSRPHERLATCSHGSQSQKEVRNRQSRSVPAS